MGILKLLIRSYFTFLRFKQPKWLRFRELVLRRKIWSRSTSLCYVTNPLLLLLLFLFVYSLFFLLHFRFISLPLLFLSFTDFYFIYFFFFFFLKKKKKKKKKK